MEALFDYEEFILKYEDILDAEYIDYCRLLDDAQDIILNPGGKGFNYLGEIWYLHSFETFIKNCKNVYLKGAAQGIYEQNLALFLGQYNSSLFYSDDKFTVMDDFITAAEGYIIRYPEDETAKICEYVLNLVYEYPNKDILGKINTYLREYIDDADWLPLDSAISEPQEIYKEEIIY
jgi:hypothetical protein